LSDDKLPALIAQCIDSDDVITAVNFARTHDLLVTVRGGGHGISGKAVENDTLLIDLSKMSNLSADPTTMTAVGEPGVLLRELDRGTQAHGMVVPAGVVSHTGISGLTLGGGIGINMRKMGLTIDNLLSVQIVTADGKLRTASDTENTDLFWAVRGGGGNFGIVTSYTYRMHKLDSQILSGVVVYAMDDAKDMYDRYFDYSLEAPRELNMSAAMSMSPTGTPFLMAGFQYMGSPKEGEKVLKSYRTLGNPVADLIKPKSFLRQQTLLDAGNPHGTNYYIRGRTMDEYDSDLIDVMMDRWNHSPGRHNTMRLIRFGGAVDDVAPDATAWPHRGAKWDLELGGSWVDPSLSAKNIKWGKDYWDALAPYVSDRFYINEMMDETQEEVAVSYGDNYPRLVQIKNKYDPKNFFRSNGNIKPTV
jgi:FAD/FMN-containing dehydrogenase